MVHTHDRAPEGQPVAAGRGGGGLFSEEFERLRSQFKGNPLPVSFRELVGPVPVNDGPHRIHPYPAKLVRQLPSFFLECDQLTDRETVVLDPFCGTGTVLVEAVNKGFNCWGTDSNPLAALISEVKTTPVDKDTMLATRDFVVRSSAAQKYVRQQPDPFLDRWFSGPVRSALATIQTACTHSSLEASQRNAALLALSLASDRLAHKDRRIPVPVRSPGELPVKTAAEVRSTFRQAFDFVAARLPSRSDQLASSRVFCQQAQNVRDLVRTERAPQPTLILTSPPYGAAQKYVRSSSISMVVLGLSGAKQLQEHAALSAGREWLRASDRGMELPEGLMHVPGMVELVDKIAEASPVRGDIYRQYFADMWGSFQSGVSILKPGGHMVLVSSANTVAGLKIETHDALAAMAEQLGLTRVLSLEDKIAGRSLMTRRAVSASSPIQSEIVHIFAKRS